MIGRVVVAVAVVVVVVVAVVVRVKLAMAMIVAVLMVVPVPVPVPVPVAMRITVRVAAHCRMQRVVHDIEGHRIEDRERSGLQARIPCGLFDGGRADAVAEQGQGFVKQRGGRRVHV
jgi:hypothetical protein